VKDKRQKLKDKSTFIFILLSFILFSAQMVKLVDTPA
jgi:hypothetical protein